MAGQPRCRTAHWQDSPSAGQPIGRTAQVQDSPGAGQPKCRTAQVQDSPGAGQPKCCPYRGPLKKYVAGQVRPIRVSVPSSSFRPKIFASSHLRILASSPLLYVTPSGFVFRLCFPIFYNRFIPSGFLVHCLPFTVHYFLPDSFFYRSPFTVHWFTVHCSLFTSSLLPASSFELPAFFTVHCSLFTVHFFSASSFQLRASSFFHRSPFV